MQRIVFHCEVPDFSVTVERIRDRRLATRAIVIALPGNPRGLVQAVSGEARRAGIVRGMRLGAAQRLCPSAVVLPPDRLLYHRAARALMQLLGRFTPVLEWRLGGRCFLDMTGTGRLFGSPRDAASRILGEVSSCLRLSAGIGIAVNKSVSQVASSLVRADLLDVLPGSEEPFLSPWQVRKLPGTEQVAEPRLFEDLNIQRIGQLAACRVCHLATAFGRLGPVLHQRAHGIDPRPVTPPSRKPYVHEEEILAEETNEREKLQLHLRNLTERCGYRMRRKGAAAATVTLQVGYTDNFMLEGSARLGRVSNNDALLCDRVGKLFYRVGQRRIRVRYLSLTFTDLSRVTTQLELFPPPDRSERENPLTSALDSIRKRYGKAAIQRGAA